MASGYTAREENGNPSEVYHVPWIWAVNRRKHVLQPDYSSNDVKSGKWLIFDEGNQVDASWDAVKEAVVAGDLGYMAKVSTMKDKDYRRGAPSEFVICVYTYDHTDETDVFRVREALRSLGFTQKLHYKTDEATMAGDYSSPGNRVSKYSA